ncbi:MAG: hypothetical protein CME40_10990 [Haliea sp.]|nr:hypothetical protein [Haliea sp.]
MRTGPMSGDIRQRRRVSLLPVLALYLWAGAVAINVHAQAAPDSPTATPAFRENIGRGFSRSAPRFRDAGPEEPDFAEPGFEEPDFDLAPEESRRQTHRRVLPRPTPGDTGTEGVASNIRVTTIAVVNNTVLPASDIEAVVAPFSHRELSPENLQELRRRLSLLYFNAGYVNSGVLLPDTLPSSGPLELQAVEGELTNILWLSPDNLPRRLLEARLRRDIDTPLNIQALQNSLRGLELNPLVRRVNAALVPGLYAGQADLQLRVEQASPLRIGLALDNYRSPSVGAERGVLTLEHLNLSGRGDRLALAANISEGLQDAYFDYALPITHFGTRLGVIYQRGESEVVEAPFEQLDIESDTESWGISLSHPLIDQLQRRVELSLGVGHSQSDTSLLGRPFSFSLGARNGEIAASHVVLGAEWIERGDQDVMALRASLRHGVDWFGATTIPGGSPQRQPETGAEIPESRFTVVLSQFQYARRLPWLHSQLVVSGAWQQAFDPLLSVEKMAIGGVHSVRGFRENQLVRDNGLSGSLEWRIPVLANQAGRSRWNLTAIPFVDYGRSWDHDEQLSTHRAAELASIGLGLRWEPSERIYLSVTYGERVADDDVPSPSEKDLQDDGFHVALAFNWPI